MKNLFKKGSKVKVCVGKDKGKTGEIIEINRFRNLAKVKGANMQKKHKKATKENKGGIISKEGFIHLSNLKNFEENKKEKNNDTKTKREIQKRDYSKLNDKA